MDLFGFVSVLIMGAATLFGLSLLLWLVVMERKPDRSGSDQPGGRPSRPAGPQQPLVRRPPARRKVAREAPMPGLSQVRGRARGSGRT
jgi:hypothetical protein